MVETPDRAVRILSIGDVIKCKNGNTYEIKRYLGQGVTAEVYEAQTDGTLAAVKALRAGISETSEENFWFEATVLGELAQAAREEQNFNGDDRLDLFPRLIEKIELAEVNTDRSVSALVIDFVEGDGLDEILEKREFLEETQALFIAERVLKLLDLLHRLVGRTYTDLQMKNIRCQSIGEDPPYRVRVIDWNHVSGRKGASSDSLFGTEDLSRFATYLYRMLTGKSADESRGETARILENRAGERWSNISLATREVLKRALHRNKNMRYETAKEFLSAIQEVRKIWREDWVDLTAEVSQSGVDLDRAQVLLDMAERKGDPAPREIVEKLRQRLPKGGTVATSAWQSGQLYFDSNSFREAADKWRQEAETEGKVAPWRWVMLAEAAAVMGKDRFLEWRAPLESAVQSLAAGNSRQAMVQFDSFHRQGIQAPGLDALCDEAVTRVKIADATIEEDKNTPENWTKSAALYRDANERLNCLVYGQVIREEEGWEDLADRVNMLEQRARERRESLKLQSDTTRILQSDLSLGVKQLQQALKEDPQNQALVEICLREGINRIETNKLADAVRLLEVGVRYGQVPELAQQMWITYQDALKKRQSDEELQRSKQALEGLLRAVREEHWHEVIGFATRAVATESGPGQDDVIHELSTRYDLAIKNRELPIAQIVLTALGILDQNSSEQTARQQRYGKMLDDITNEQNRWRDSFFHWVDQQEHERSPLEYPELIRSINRSMTLADNDDLQFREEVEKRINELQQGYQQYLERTKLADRLHKMTSETYDAVQNLDDTRLAELVSLLDELKSEAAAIEDQKLQQSIDSLTTATLPRFRALAHRFTQERETFNQIAGASPAGKTASEQWNSALQAQALIERLQRLENQARAEWDKLGMMGEPNFLTIEELCQQVQPYVQDSSHTSRRSRLSWFPVVLAGATIVALIGMFLWTQSRFGTLESRTTAMKTSVEDDLANLSTPFAEVEGMFVGLATEMPGLGNRIAALEVSMETVIPLATPVIATPWSETSSRGESIFSFESWSADPVYLLPPLKFVDPAGWTSSVGTSGEWLVTPAGAADQIVTRPVQVTVDNELVLGKLQKTDDGSYLWRPSLQSSILAPGVHTVRAFVANDGWKPEELAALEFLVADPPQTAVLKTPELRSEPIVEDQYILISQPFNAETQLRVLGRYTLAPDDLSFLLVRGEGSTISGWVLFNENNVSGITQDEVNQLSVLQP